MLAAKNSRKRIEARSPPAAASTGSSGRRVDPDKLIHGVAFAARRASIMRRRWFASMMISAASSESSNRRCDANGGSCTCRSPGKKLHPGDLLATLDTDVGQRPAFGDGEGRSHQFHAQ